jgi:hypothetical protein
MRRFFEVCLPAAGYRWLLFCSYEVRSGRRIALVFEEAQLGKVRVHMSV